MGLDKRYVGDGLPLCSDLPERHFLLPGATYRLLGSADVADLLHESPKWAINQRTRQLRIDESSALYARLCNSPDGSPTNCQYNGKVVIDDVLACSGLECTIESPRIVEVNDVF